VLAPPQVIAERRETVATLLRMSIGAVRLHFQSCRRSGPKTQGGLFGVSMPQLWGGRLAAQRLSRAPANLWIIPLIRIALQKSIPGKEAREGKLH
jgi:hypothetical protein